MRDCRIQKKESAICVFLCHKTFNFQFPIHQLRIFTLCTPAWITVVYPEWLV